VLRRFDASEVADHTIVLGDLNYRLSVPTAWAAAYRESLVGRLVEEANFKQLYVYDQVPALSERTRDPLPAITAAMTPGWRFVVVSW